MRRTAKCNGGVRERSRVRSKRLPAALGGGGKLAPVGSQRYRTNSRASIDLVVSRGDASSKAPVFAVQPLGKF